MSEDPAQEGASPVGAVPCDQCGQEVPALAWCIRCGDPLGPERRRGRSGRVREAFAAAPEERTRAVRLVSTLYPALPREEIRTFQAALVGGTLLVILLAALGFHPVAVVAAAVLVPLVTILYLVDVDTYEDEPVRVLAVTFLWGALTGALFALALDRIFPVGVAAGLEAGPLGVAAPPGFPVGRTIVAPIAGGLIALAGPLFLLRYRRFNDVLDGATFGVTAAVAFVGAQTIVTSAGLFQSGLRPVSPEVLSWVVRLLSLGVVTPVIAAAAVGGLAGVLWLRLRGPDAHEGMLGPLGLPPVAALLAAALLVATPVIDAVGGEEAPVQVVRLVLLVLVAAVALLWLRRIIHTGLIQESLEIPVGPPAACASCGEATPRHTFCGACGVALRALPKERGDATAAPLPAAHARLGAQRLLIAFGVLLAAVTIVALVVAWMIGQGLDRPACPDREQPCPLAAIALPRLATSADAVDGPPFPGYATVAESASGIAVTYDPEIWVVSANDAGFLALDGYGGVISWILDTARRGELDLQGLFDLRRDFFRTRLLGFEKDREPARRLLGTPTLGHRPGIGGLFGGTIDSPQGPGQEVSVAIVGSVDGSAIGLASVIVPFEVRDAGLQLGDSLNNALAWPSDEVP